MFNFVKKYKDKINILKILPFSIIIVILLLTIGFSAYQSDLIVGDIGATVRIEKEIRVTGVIASNPVSNAISNWEEYNASNISSNISLPNSDSTMTYYVEITNFGNVESGISEISGLPSNLTYSISNYELNNTLCDDNDNSKCKLGSVSTLAITIGYAENGYDSSNTNYVFQMDFTFYYLDATARIGNKYYDTLEAAIDDVPTDNTLTTVVLLKDTSELITVSANHNIVFDFAGATLSNNGSVNVIRNYGTLKIISGTISSTADQGIINNYGDLFMSGGSLIANGNRQAIYNDGGNVTISGTAYIYNKGTQRASVQNQANSTLTVLGGTVVSNGSFAISNSGTMTIGVKDGNVDSSSPVLQGAFYGISSSTNYGFYNGIVKGKTNPFTGTGTVSDTEEGYGFLYSKEKIDGTTYKTARLAIVSVVTFNPNGGTVDENTRNVETGTAIGELPVPVRDEYVFEGWWTEASGGTEITDETVITADIEYYAHWIHQSEIFIAKIGDTKYDSLEEAISDVPNDVETTIDLARNTSGTFEILANKDIVINLHGNTIRSNNNNKAIFENKGNLKIVGGTITSSATTVGAINNNTSANLTITDTTIRTTDTRQAVYNLGGTVLINGSSYLSSTASGKPVGSNMERATIQNLNNGTVTIVSGTIIGIYQQAISNEGTLNLGIQGDGFVSSSTPVIRGETYGIKSTKTINYYDGIIKGITSPISGTISNQEANTSIVNGTEVIDGKTYITSILQ